MSSLLTQPARRRLSLLVVLGGGFAAAASASAVGCTDSDPTPSTAVDAGTVDTGTTDANVTDASTPDTSSPTDGGQPTDAANDVEDGAVSDAPSDAPADALVDGGSDASAASRILFVTGQNIWAMDPDGSNLTNLTNTSGINYGYPAWSPDRTKIAFNSDKDDGSGEIYVMDANGSNMVRLTTDVGESDVEPTWSPDGTRIAFASRRDHLIGSIYACDALDGANVVRITNAMPGSDENPSWSVTNKIAFHTNEGAIGIHVAVVDIDFSSPPDGGADGGLAWGTNRNGFAANRAFGMYPSWSPDGSKIAFAEATSGGRITLMNPDGTGQTAITTSGMPEEHPRWSPDQTRIAFDRNVTGHLDIFTMAATGGSELRLTSPDAGTNGIEPSW